MRLLSRTEVKKKIGYKSKFERIRNRKEIENSKKDLSTVITETEDKRHELQREFDAFVVSIALKKDKLLAEVGILEKQKEVAMEPLDDLEDDLYRRQSEQDILQKEIEKEHKHLQGEWDDLTTERDNVAEKEGEVREENVKLDKREKNLVPDEMRITRQREKFDLHTMKEMKLINEANKVLDKRKKVADVRDIENERFRQELALKEKLLKAREDGVKKDRKHLESQQQSLRAAYEITRSKNNS